MWIVIFFVGWLLLSLALSPLVGHFIFGHLKVNDDVEKLNTKARELGLDHQTPDVGGLEPGKARLTPN